MTNKLKHISNKVSLVTLKNPMAASREVVTKRAKK